MKKIIAILLTLAVVPFAFAQTVSVSNSVATDPQIKIDGGTHYWEFNGDAALMDVVIGEAITEDGRARVKGSIEFDIQTLDPSERSILSAKPRWSWTSSDDGVNYNRSRVAAVLKPWDFLEIGIGNLGKEAYLVDSSEPDYTMKIGPDLDYEWSTLYSIGFNYIPGIVSKFQRLSSLVYDGIHFVYTGVPNLKIGVGFESALNLANQHGYRDRSTTIKKGMFFDSSLGATYDTDLFSVGAVWKGNFGGSTGPLAEQNDKAHQEHTIYASFTFKGLQEAKIGTNIYVAAGFYTDKASKVYSWQYYDQDARRNVTKFNVSATSFLFDIGANLDFRNGIKNDINVGIGYYKLGPTKTKVLPFCVRDTISYSVSSEATFAFTIGYSQSGLAEKKAVAGIKNTNNNSITAAGAESVATTDGNFAWLVFAFPRFTWNMGAHSFLIGLRATVDGDLVPHEKTGHEWGWTGLRGKCAVIDFPLSWTYTF